MARPGALKGHELNICARIASGEKREAIASERGVSRVAIHRCFHAYATEGQRAAYYALRKGRKRTADE